jgi:DHA3 family tetracycline resistance protein-like MFS transporter
MQELVPNDRLGRVTSIDLLGSFALLPVGFGLAGWATNAFGAATVCVIGGALTVGVAALGLAHPAIRALD